ncbi:LysE type translocator family protein [Xanthomonas citri pv. mangiferaeindicae LMG 941]|nr:LysE type translocator family protein [Xanthomonas citri pv. mangiferaeindicae]CCG35455.1 LysE type translocator family protein [Xanthomonas citri pv. mangiferaeindicae LMG 941]
MIVQATVAGFLAGAGLIVAIGAQNAFVLRQGLKRQHVGLVVTICALGDIALILLGVAGIGVLAQQWSGLLQVLRYAGAAFLAVYGWMAARRAWRGDGAMSPAEQGEDRWQRAMLTCLAFTFLNPHVYLDTMLLLGSLATHYPGALRWAFALGACGQRELVLWPGLWGPPVAASVPASACVADTGWTDRGLHAAAVRAVAAPRARGAALIALSGALCSHCAGTTDISEPDILLFQS